MTGNAWLMIRGLVVRADITGFVVEICDNEKRQIESFDRAKRVKLNQCNNK